MNPLAIPQEYYAKEGILSLMGLGYTAALATVGLTIANMAVHRNLSKEMLAALLGGAVATWGYLKDSDLDYAQS